MTVIAYRDGIMAADSGAWQGETFVGVGRKIWRLKDGSLLATTGRWTDGEVALEWFSAGQTGDRPKVDDSFGGILVKPDGLVLQIGAELRLFELTADFHADGCGMDLAMGAMAAGATAPEAVKIACRLNARCRGPVQVERL